MAQDKMTQLASDLADELLKTPQTEFIKDWGIKNLPDEEVMVIVIRRKKSETDLIEKAIKAVSGPFTGTQTCPMCKGTGSI